MSSNYAEDIERLRFGMTDTKNTTAQRVQSMQEAKISLPKFFES